MKFNFCVKMTVFNPIFINKSIVFKNVTIITILCQKINLVSKWPFVAK